MTHSKLIEILRGLQEQWHTICMGIFPINDFSELLDLWVKR